MISSAPMFQSIFGTSWDDMPTVMHNHYAIRLGSNDKVIVEGNMEIRRSRIARLLSPLLVFFGALVPYSGTGIPAKVTFYNPPNSNAFIFDRVFTLPDNRPYRFRSQLEPLNDNEVIEFMRFGIGWRCRYTWDGQRVLLHHVGYVWRVLGCLIPLPLATLIGKGRAWEEPLSDNSFRMWMGVEHRWFGETYSYAGTFQVMEVIRG